MQAPTQLQQQTPEKQKGRIFNTAFVATIAFVALSHPIAYRIMNQAFHVITSAPNEIIGENGAITLKGIALHAAIFFVVMMFLLIRK